MILLRLIYRFLFETDVRFYLTFPVVKICHISLANGQSLAISYKMYIEVMHIYQIMAINANHIYVKKASEVWRCFILHFYIFRFAQEHMNKANISLLKHTWCVARVLEMWYDNSIGIYMFDNNVWRYCWSLIRSSCCRLCWWHGGCGTWCVVFVVVRYEISGRK